MEIHVVAEVRREWEIQGLHRRLGRRWEENMKLFLNKKDEILCTGFIWLRTGKVLGILGRR
jgi:hypothetical protein